MKNTKQKNVILDIINKSNNHLNAYQIYDDKTQYKYYSEFHIEIK